MAGRTSLCSLPYQCLTAVGEAYPAVSVLQRYYTRIAVQHRCPGQLW